MSKILKAGAVTFIKEKVLYTEVGQAAAETEYEDEDSDFEGEQEEDVYEPPKETPEQLAEKILGQARIEADAIINQARQKAEKEAEAISNQAWEQGHQEGMDLASSEGDAIRAQAQKVLMDAEEERKKIINNTEADIVDLIIKITGKLINSTFQINPGVITALIKRGLSGTNLTGEIFVHVSPDDYDAAVSNKDELMTVADSSTRLEIIKDPSLNPMDCVIETPFGNVDCSLNQGYEALTQNLKYILNGK